MSVYHGFNKIDPSFALDVNGNVRIYSDQIRFGVDAGESNQGTYAIAVGSGSGQSNQSANAIAIGYQAGQSNQGSSSIAIGTLAGQTNQPANSIIINATGAILNGLTANAFYVKPVRPITSGNIMYYNANTNEVSYGLIPPSGANISNGTNWGDYIYWSNVSNQWSVGSSKVSIGKNAGLTNQGLFSVAIGEDSGRTNQAQWSTAMGYQAGQTTQGQWSTAMGYQAGQTDQKQWATAIGYQAGQTNQGQNAVAIGYLAGQTNQPAQSIVINGSLAGITSTLVPSAFYVNPIRSVTGEPSTLSYNAISNEITYVNTWLNNTTGVYYSTGTVAIGTTPDATTSLKVSANNTVGISYVRTGAKDARISVGDPTKTWSISSGWALAGDWSLIEEGSSGIRLYAAKTAGPNVFAGVLTSTPQYTWDINGTVHYASAVISSDIRIKTNISENNPKDILKNMRHIQSYTFEWSNLINECRDGYPLNTPTIGYIANEIEPYYPDMINKWELYYPNGNLALSNVLGVETDSMVSLLTGAVNGLNVCKNKHTSFNLGTFGITQTSNNMLATVANNLFTYPYESYNVSNVSVQYVTNFKNISGSIDGRIYVQPFMTVNGNSTIYGYGESTLNIAEYVRYSSGESFSLTIKGMYPATSIPDNSNIKYGLNISKSTSGTLNANINMSVLMQPFSQSYD
jgi:Chaperone of endosialidase